MHDGPQDYKESASTRVCVNVTYMLQYDHGALSVLLQEQQHRPSHRTAGNSIQTQTMRGYYEVQGSPPKAVPVPYS